MAGAISAGIDPDPVRPEHRLFADDVAMHHFESPIALAAEEGLAYPQQIVERLCGYRTLRIKASVDQQIVAPPNARLEVRQEAVVAFRQSWSRNFAQSLSLGSVGTVMP